MWGGEALARIDDLLPEEVRETMRACQEESDMHLKDGSEAKVGDVVVIFATITSVSPGVDYCNCQVETLEKMYPGENKTGVTLNTKQIARHATTEERAQHYTEKAEAVAKGEAP